MYIRNWTLVSLKEIDFVIFSKSFLDRRPNWQSCIKTLFRSTNEWFKYGFQKLVKDQGRLERKESGIEGSWGEPVPLY